MVVASIVTMVFAPLTCETVNVWKQQGTASTHAQSAQSAQSFPSAPSAPAGQVAPSAPAGQVAPSDPSLPAGQVS